MGSLHFSQVELIETNISLLLLYFAPTFGYDVYLNVYVCMCVFIDFEIQHTFDWHMSFYVCIRYLFY